jgi:Flp pilus assembly CpaE family ATPase
VTESLSLLVISHPEIFSRLQLAYPPSGDKPIEAVYSLPVFSLQGASSYRDRFMPQVIVVDAKVEGLGDQTDVLRTLQRESNSPFLLIGLAEPAALSSSGLANVCNVMYPLPLTDVILERMAREIPAAFTEQANQWRERAFISADMEAIRSEIAQHASSGWMKQKIGIYANKGGVGGSTLAVELASLLAGPANRSVCLLDINARGGSLAYRLQVDTQQVDPQTNWRHPVNISALAESYQKSKEGNKDGFAEFEKLLDTLLVPVPSLPKNLFFLPGVLNPRDAENHFTDPDFCQEFLSHLLEIVHHRFDFVVVDCGSPAHHPLHKAVLRQLSVLLTVCTSDEWSVFDLAMQLDALHAEFRNLSQERVYIVLNQYLPNPNVSPKSIRKHLSVPVIGEIPFCPEFQACANSGHSLSETYLEKTKNNEAIEAALAGLVNAAGLFFKPLLTVWSQRNKKQGQSIWDKLRK